MLNFNKKRHILKKLSECGKKNLFLKVICLIAALFVSAFYGIACRMDMALSDKNGNFLGIRETKKGYVKYRKPFALRLSAMILAVSFSFTFVPELSNILGIAASAEETITIVKQNQCGDNVYWELDGTGTLSVTGSGAMYDYSDESPSPFKGSSSINKVTVGNGVTSIGSRTFSGCLSLTTVTIPDSVTQIAPDAFSGCSVTLCGNAGSYAEEYAKANSIPFIAAEQPAATGILALINEAASGAELVIDTAKYGTVFSAEEAAAAKEKNLKLYIKGSNFTWTALGTLFPDSSVDFTVTAPCIKDMPSLEKTEFDRSYDLSVKNPSGAGLTVTTDPITTGMTANIFEFDGTSFKYAESVTIGSEGTISFIPEDNTVYFIPISDKAIDTLTVRQQTYTLTLPENVTVTRNGEALTAQSVLNSGDQLTISAFALEGYHIASLKVNGTEIENNSVYTVGNENVVITLEYAPDETDCVHDYGTGWKTDSSSHWRECSLCGELTERAAHIRNSGTFIAKPTATEKGYKEYQCTVCAFEWLESIPPLGEDHVHDSLTQWRTSTSEHWHECSACGEVTDKAAHTEDDGVILRNPTADTEGIEKFTCSVCGNERTVILPVIDSTHTHELDDTWSYDSASHWKSCKICLEKTSAVPHTEDKGTVTVYPTKEASGVRTYSCIVCGYVIRTETIPALDEAHTHTYSGEWSTDGIAHWHVCICGDKADLAEHTENNGVITVQPTITTTGTKVYSCSVCGYVLRTETLPKNDHEHAYNTYWTYNQLGHWHECECGEKADHTAHKANSGTVTKQATLYETGEMTYSCKDCGYIMYVEEIPMLTPEHTHKFTDTWMISVTHHWYLCSCGKTANYEPHKDDGGVIISAPTATSSGLRKHSCAVCGYTLRTTVLPATGSGSTLIPPSNSILPNYPTTSLPNNNTGGSIIDDIYDSAIPDQDIVVKLDSKLKNLSDGTLQMKTKTRFFGESVNVVLSQTADSRVAAAKALNVFEDEKSICYPFDITIYSIANGEETVMRTSDAYITFEVPVPAKMEFAAEMIKVYHVPNGAAEKIPSEIYRDRYGNRMIRFTATSFSPYMFVVWGYEDVSSGAGSMAESSPAETAAAPVSNGVSVPQGALPEGLKFSRRKRRYHILHKTRINISI